MGKKKVKKNNKKENIFEREEKTYKRYLLKTLQSNLQSTMNMLNDQSILSEETLNDSFSFMKDYMSSYNKKLNNVVDIKYVSELISCYSEFIKISIDTDIEGKTVIGSESPEVFSKIVNIFKESNKNMQYLLVLNNFVLFDDLVNEDEDVRFINILMVGYVQMLYIALIKGGLIKDSHINFVCYDLDKGEVFIDYEDGHILRKSDLKLIDKVRQNANTLTQEEFKYFKSLLAKNHFITDSIYLCSSTNYNAYQMYDVYSSDEDEELDVSLKNSLFLKDYDDSVGFDRKYLYPKEGVKLYFSNKNEILREIIIIEDHLSYFFSVELKNGYLNKFKISKEYIDGNGEWLYAKYILSVDDTLDYLQVLKYSLYIAYCNPKAFKDLKIFNNVRNLGSGSSKQIHFKVAHLRKLPEGYKASEGALNKARTLGFEDIPNGYTFVSASNEQLSKMKEIVI